MFHNNNNNQNSASHSANWHQGSSSPKHSSHHLWRWMQNISVAHNPQGQKFLQKKLHDPECNLNHRWKLKVSDIPSLQKVLSKFVTVFALSSWETNQQKQNYSCMAVIFIISYNNSANIYTAHTVSWHTGAFKVPMESWNYLPSVLRRHCWFSTRNDSRPASKSCCVNSQGHLTCISHSNQLLASPTGLTVITFGPSQNTQKP